MSKLKVVELFGGIGAPRKALENLGIDFEVVDYVEIDKYAVKSYNAMYNENFEVQDVTKWDKDIEFDLIFHGSPCQDFSIAGKQAGADEDSGTRSSLMYETLRITKKLRPKYVIWENVKNVLSKKHIHNFDKYLEELKNIGYTNYYQVLNSADYKIPQERKRVFVVSIEGENKPFNFPVKQKLEVKLKDVLEYNVDEKYYISPKALSNYKFIRNRKYKWLTDVNGISKCLTASMHKGYGNDGCAIIKIGYINSDSQGQRVYDINGLAVTQSAQGGGWGAKTGLYEVSNERYRKLTPLECWRLMGFDDEDFYKAEQVNSNTQLYKQAGNSIVVNVLEKLLIELFKQ